MISDYRQLDQSRAATLIERHGVWLLINGDVTKGIFLYPTLEQVQAREGQPAQGKTLRTLSRFPEIWLERGKGSFSRGNPLRVLCQANQPDFILDEFEPSESALYRITLSPAGISPVDTAGRKWR